MIRRYTRIQLAAHAKRRPRDYLKRLMSAAVTRSPEWIDFDTEHPAYVALAEEFKGKGTSRAFHRVSAGQPDPPPRPKPEPIKPVPRDEWPLPIKALALVAKPEDKGVGDTAQRVLAGMGADALAKLYEKATGKPCGCKDKQARLNALYPYQPK